MENLKLSQEQIEKAREAKTPKKLQELAAENGIQLTMEQAEQGYAQLHHSSSELSDDELNNVSGGGCDHEPRKCRRCGGTDLMYVASIPGYLCRECHQMNY